MPALHSLVRRFFVSLAFIVSLGLDMPAAAQARLEGRAVDPQGRPVAGALIVVAGANGTLIETRTDAQGRFVVDDISDTQRYDVTASAPGLLGERRAVDAAAAAPLEIPMRLSALTETVVVSASQVDQPLSRTPDSVTVIGGHEIEARQIASLGDALAFVPGFDVARNGGPGTVTSAFPRGGESDFTLVLVDGIRANAFGGGIDLSQVPLADVERIEVVRGPQSALFGADAIGGVIQVITRQGGPPRLAARAEAGSRATRRGQASSTGSLGAFRWQGGIDYAGDDGFTGMAANGERVSNDDAQQRQAWAGAGWRGGRGTDLQATFRYVETERGAPGPYGSDPAGRFARVDRIARSSTARRAGGLRLVHPWFGPSSRVRQRVEIDTADYDVGFVSAFGRSRSETRRTHARVQTDAALAPALGVSTGIEWIGESGRSSFVRSASGEVPIERRVIGAFGEARSTLHDRLSLQAGLRIEHIRRDAFVLNAFADDSLVSVNPKVSVSWLAAGAAPGDGGRSWTRVHGAAGTGIRPPDVFEIAFTDNPSLKPERSRSVEAGVTQALASGALQIDATAFVNQYDDLIVSVGSLRDVSRYRTDNVSNARARGLELSAAWQGTRGLGARATYTYLQTAILAVDNAAQAPSPYRVGDWLLRRPRHSGSLTLTWTAPRATLFGALAARGRTLDAEPSFGPSGGLYWNSGRTVVDAGGSFAVAPQLEIYARALNLFDRRYEDVFGYPAPGRTAFVGVRLAARR